MFTIVGTFPYQLPENSVRSCGPIYIITNYLGQYKSTEWNKLCSHHSLCNKGTVVEARIALLRYSDVIVGAMASQITSLSIVYSGADQRKHQNSASLAFVRGINPRPVNSPHLWPVTRNMFPFDDVIIWQCWYIEPYRNALSPHTQEFRFLLWNIHDRHTYIGTNKSWTCEIYVIQLLDMTKIGAFRPRGMFSSVASSDKLNACLHNICLYTKLLISIFIPRTIFVVTVALILRFFARNLLQTKMSPYGPFSIKLPRCQYWLLYEWRLFTLLISANVYINGVLNRLSVNIYWLSNKIQEGFHQQYLLTQNHSWFQLCQQRVISKVIPWKLWKIWPDHLSDQAPVLLHNIHTMGRYIHFNHTNPKITFSNQMFINIVRVSLSL